MIFEPDSSFVEYVWTQSHIFGTLLFQCSSF